MIAKWMLDLHVAQATPPWNSEMSVSYTHLEEAVEAYRSFYEDAPLVTVLDAGAMPRTASVAGTCRCQIGLAVDPRTGVLVATGAIDNLCKGAAGQAVQLSLIHI